MRIDSELIADQIFHLARRHIGLERTADRIDKIAVIEQDRRAGDLVDNGAQHDLLIAHPLIVPVYIGMSFSGKGESTLSFQMIFSFADTFERFVGIKCLDCQPFVYDHIDAS